MYLIKGNKMEGCTRDEISIYFNYGNYISVYTKHNI